MSDDENIIQNIHLRGAALESFTRKGDGRDIAVMMSGGVDSSVVALILREAGWNVLGVTMRLPISVDCVAEAAEVCARMDIPHCEIDLRDVFDEVVISPFRRDYEEGKTPSPCVGCNRALKFGAAWDLIEKEFDVDQLATGHYVRVVRGEGEAYLCCGLESGRDQSYFLYSIRPERLECLHLPLGERRKDDIRRIAAENGLGVEDKEDSMELCFADDGDYRRALGNVPCEEGAILDVDGREVGRHTGIVNYTLGQRRGLGVAGPEPYYVLKIDPCRNTVMIGTRSQAYSTHVCARNVNFHRPRFVKEGSILNGRIRSAGKLTPCRITEVSDAYFAVEFAEPMFAPAPGQHLVLYAEDGGMVGGGEICERECE